MKRFFHCPICYNKLKSRQFENNIKQFSCKKGIAHYISFKSKDEQILSMILYFDNYSVLEMDFVNKMSIYYYEPLNNLSKFIIPKIIELDFPELKKLKEKLTKYVLFT